MNILELLRNMNLKNNQYNIVGVVWFSLMGLFLYWFYIRCGHERIRIPFGILFSFSSTLMLTTLSDEINLFLFMVTRNDFLSAYALYWTIPDKISRVFIVLISLIILTHERFGFEHYWKKGGLFVILGITSAYAVISIITGMYGWEITDPTNLAKYFYTYVLYYILFFALIFKFYPNWARLRLHIAMEHPELRKNKGVH